jgi:hypothetical protein
VNPGVLGYQRNPIPGVTPGIESRIFEAYPEPTTTGMDFRLHQTGCEFSTRLAWHDQLLKISHLKKAHCPQTQKNIMIRVKALNLN